MTMGRLRLFLALLIVDWTLGTPGVGVETRSSTNSVTNDVMGWVYAVAFLALIVALALTWFRRDFAGPLAMAVGGSAAVLAVADVFGLAGGGPAPSAMVVVDVFGIVIGAAIVWAASRAGRSAPLPA
jgi:uncharacterized membrane protein